MRLIHILMNNRGCFGGGGGKTPAPPPTPAPAPTPTPEMISGVNDDERRRKLDRQRMGFASTLKTSQRGIFGSGSQVNAPAVGSKTLG